MHIDWENAMKRQQMQSMVQMHSMVQKKTQRVTQQTTPHNTWKMRKNSTEIWGGAGKEANSPARETEPSGQCSSWREQRWPWRFGRGRA